MPGLEIILVPVALVLIYAVVFDLRRRRRGARWRINIEPSGYAVTASRDDDRPEGSSGGSAACCDQAVAPGPGWASGAPSGRAAGRARRLHWPGAG